MAKKIGWKTITVTEKNKNEIERIKRELERSYKKSLAIDIAISHILKIYNATMKVEREKKTKQNDDKLSLENIKVGDIIPDLHNKDIEITDDLIEQMKRYEQDSGKSAIWRNKITGSFLFYKLTKENPREKNKSKKL